MELKPLKCNGHFIDGSDFKPILFSKKQAVEFARKQLAKSKKHGCKKFGVKDYGSFYAYTIW